MMRKSLLVLAVSAALTIAAVAAPGNGNKPAQPITVGDFAVMISQAIGRPATSPQRAVANLQARGLNTPLDLNARLTERLAVSMFHDLGVVNVRTTNPGDQVSPDRAEAILGSVNLSALSASILPADHNEDPFGHAGACLQLRNRGLCQDCCKLAVGSQPNPEPNPDDPDGDLTIDPGRICAKFCKAVLPPGLSSPSEPEP